MWLIKTSAKYIQTWFKVLKNFLGYGTVSYIHMQGWRYGSVSQHGQTRGTEHKLLFMITDIIITTTFYLYWPWGIGLYSVYCNSLSVDRYCRSTCDLWLYLPETWRLRGGPSDLVGGAMLFFEKNSLFPIFLEKNSLTPSMEKINCLLLVCEKIMWPTTNTPKKKLLVPWWRGKKLFVS